MLGLRDIQPDERPMKAPICLWSGPRNVSTALMYSFAQRRDIRVVDEPLYGHYLHVSGARHPGRDVVLANMNCNGSDVMESLLREQELLAPVRLFLKHMAHHLVDLDLSFLQRTCNVFLIRDPLEMLPSLTIQLPDARLADTGLQRQWELFSQLRDAGQSPTIVDSRELLLDPESILTQLCRNLNLEFDSAMLTWPAGPIAEDGVWASYWYQSVHQSTGFAPYRRKHDFPADLEALYRECKPWYDKLFEHALLSRSNGD
jgi:hypothetical protein